MVNRCGSRGFFLIVLLVTLLSACGGKGNSEYDQYDAVKGSSQPVPESARPEGAAPLKIMPLGDSITQGDQNHRSYRYFLWKKLLDMGVPVDFVGSMTLNFNGDPKWPDYRGQSFDRDHEGHWGWRTDEVLEKLPEWLLLNRPDIVLLHLGSNDMFYNNSLESTIQELRSVVEHLRTANPEVTVFLAQILPANRQNAEITLLNDAIAALSQEMHRPQSPLYLVDQNRDFSVTDDTYDGIHPDASGEVKMASRWLVAMQNAGIF